MAKIVIANKNIDYYNAVRLKASTEGSVTVNSNNPGVSYNGRILDVGLGALTSGLALATTKLERFDPMYWVADGIVGRRYCITTVDNGFAIRTNNDEAVKAVWYSEDQNHHLALSYATNKDYSGLTWEFVLELDSSLPVINDADKPAILTVKYIDEQERPGIAYIALQNYAESPASRKSKVTIDWSKVKAGINANLEFPVDQIESIAFNLVSKGVLTVTDSKVSGTGTTIDHQHVVNGKHHVGITTHYDKLFNINPARIVKCLVDLGCHGNVIHHLGTLQFSTLNGSFKISESPTTRVNAIAKLWHSQYLKALTSFGLTLTIVVSAKAYTDFVPDSWCQVSNDGTYATLDNDTFLSLGNSAVQEYLSTIIAELVAELSLESVVLSDCYWYNDSAFDAVTKALYKSETKNDAPADMYEGTEGVEEYQDWLSITVGNALLDIGSASDATPFGLLVRSDIDGYNVPATISEYARIVVDGSPSLLSQPPKLYDLQEWFVNTVMTDWGYKPKNVQYIAGFVPTLDKAADYGIDYYTGYGLELYCRMLGSIYNHNELMFNQHIADFSAICLDAVTLVDDGFYMDNDYHGPVTGSEDYPEWMYPEVVPEYKAPVLPEVENITLVRSSYGDIRVRWDNINPAVTNSFEVQVMNSSEYYSLFSKRTDGDTVFFTQAECLEYGITGSEIPLLVIPAYGVSKLETVTVVESDEFVERVVYIAGDDSASANFNALSTIDGVNGADIIRNEVAVALEVDPVSIVTVSLAFSGSVVDSNSSTGTEKFWYDSSTGSNGELLDTALTIVEKYKSIPTASLVWIAGSNDILAKNEDEESFSDANSFVVDALLDAMPEGTMAHWSVLGRRYDPATLLEVNGETAQRYRQMQLDLIEANDNYALGAIVHEAATIEGYITDTTISKYTKDIYTDIAYQMGSAVGYGDDLFVEAPEWYGYTAVEDLTVEAVTDGVDISWTAHETLTDYRLRLLDPEDGTVAYSVDVTTLAVEIDTDTLESNGLIDRVIVIVSAVDLEGIETPYATASVNL